MSKVVHISQLSWLLLPLRVLPHSTYQADPWKGQACSAEVQGIELVVCSPYCSKNLEVLNFMVTAAKAAFELHIPHMLLLIDRSEVQLSTSVLVPLSLGKQTYHQHILGDLLDCLYPSVPPKDIVEVVVEVVWSPPWRQGCVNERLTVC